MESRGPEATFIRKLRLGLCDIFLLLAPVQFQSWGVRPSVWCAEHMASVSGRTVELLHEVVPLRFLREMHVHVLFSGMGRISPLEDELWEAVAPFVRKPGGCKIRVEQR